jgi:hypothetical protein
MTAVSTHRATKDFATEWLQMWHYKHGARDEYNTEFQKSEQEDHLTYQQIPLHKKKKSVLWVCCLKNPYYHVLWKCIRKPQIKNWGDWKAPTPKAYTTVLKQTTVLSTLTARKKHGWIVLKTGSTTTLFINYWLSWKRQELPQKAVLMLANAASYPRDSILTSDNGLIIVKLLAQVSQLLYILWTKG